MTLGDKPESKNAMRMPRNWAMPNVGQGDTEMVRPISVECLPDKILIRRAGGAGINRDVDIPVAGLSTVGNTVISHMLDYMATWGNAARGTCWQPELIVTVQPGAERQFDELKSLMQNSGMKIRRK